MENRKLLMMNLEGSKKMRMLVVVVLLCALGAAQTSAPKAKKDQAKAAPKKPIPVYEIALSEDTDYQPLPWPEQGIQGRVVDAYCIGDGNLYLLKPGQGLVAFTPNGIVSFLGDKMTDIPHPSTTFVGMNPSISQSGVAFRVTGIDDEKLEIRTWTDEQGRPHTEKDATNATIPYIARFDKDGTYKSAIKLDLPFIVFKFAAFNSGNLIAQGPDQNKVPRVALLDASAQFLRYLDLRKDISTSRSVSAEEIKCEGCTADIGSVVFNGYFTPWQDKILFKRELNGGARVYEIQESGDVRSVDIKPPEGYEIGGLIPSDRNWLLRFNKPDAKGVRPDTFDSLLEVDPQNGNPVSEYHLKPPYTEPETGVSCFGEGEFWGVRRDAKEEKLTVVHGGAAPYRGENKNQAPRTTGDTPR
jgi:hypothetical protein